ncbi:MAG: esterase-like activity of phytase family protein [Rhizobiaceae bacterium]|nr:esterase-like activity of phytase family protein [Rhizobiaceae bacterium]
MSALSASISGVRSFLWRSLYGPPPRGGAIGHCETPSPKSGLAWLRLAASALVAAALLAHPALAEGKNQPAQIITRPITELHIGSAETRFGPLEFVGGLEMTSAYPHFGALSAFRFLTPGEKFMGVADTGYWYFGTIDRDTEGRPAGISDFSMEQMVDAEGQPISRKWLVDAEGLDVEDGIATVSFERDHRIAQFRIEPGNMKSAFRTLNFLVPKAELRQNRGFETVTRAHPQGQHENALVVVSEKSLDKNGNIFAAIIEAPNKGVFTVKRRGEFDITDGAFLPNGDLLLLESSFSMAEGVRMRLRRIYGESIAKGSLADGPILLEADMGYQIDNMEGMDVWMRADGATMVSLVSDDNHSMLQRNLYLEFVLNDE